MEPSDNLINAFLFSFPVKCDKKIVPRLCEGEQNDKQRRLSQTYGLYNATIVKKT